MTIEAKFEIVRPGGFSLDVDLVLPSRGVTALFGPSGSGKTSLLRAIAGLERFSGGALTVDGAPWQCEDFFLPPHRRSLAYVFQEPSLFSHLTVRKNIEFGAKRTPADDRVVSLDAAVELLDLRHLLERRPVHLSGGERQRVAIARALAVSPKLLLMDEPLAALERSRKQEIIPYLERLNTELDLPLIYVSHSIDEVARLADELVLFGTGRIVAVGPIGEIMTRLDLPLALDRDAEAVIEATVVEHDDEFHLSKLEFPGGLLSVGRKDLPLGAVVKLRVAARDVSVTLEPQAGTSILNIFAASIDDLQGLGDAQVVLRLDAGGVPLLALVTRKSCAALGLTRGKRVFVQAKSVAVLA